MGQASWPKSSRKGIGVYTPTPREYLLAVASGRIAVVGTKVFELSHLSVVRSNRRTRLNIESGIPFVFADLLLRQQFFCLLQLHVQFDQMWS